MTLPSSASEFTSHRNVFKVSSVCALGDRYLTVSFGPSCEVVISAPVGPSVEMWTQLKLSKQKVYDVRTADVFNQSLLLGAAKRAVYTPDIDGSRYSWTYLETGSDVFAIHQMQNFVLTGSRNGSIKRFDMRVGSGASGDELLSGRFKATNSSITYLKVVPEWQLIVASIAGHMEMFDLRFARGDQPLMTFAGHVNSYSTDLGITIDPSQEFIFAAGQDQCVRGWSLRTGNLLHMHEGGIGDTHSGGTHLLQFENPIPCLQVSEERERKTLWVATGKSLKPFIIG